MRSRLVPFVLSVLAPSLAFAQGTVDSPASAPAEPAAATPQAAPEPAPAEPAAATSQAAPEPAQPSQPNLTEPDPVAAPMPVAAPVYAEAPAPSEKPAPVGPQKQGSLYMGSPIWLTDSPLDPGFEIEMRSGIKIKSWVPEIGFGARWNWFNVDKLKEQYPSVAAPNLFAGENLTGIWLSLGLRFEPELKNSKIQPYVSVAFDANLWGFSYETTQICGFWSCGTVRQYDFAPGFSSRVGIRIQPNPRIGIDLGAKPAMTFQGWAFQSTHAWIEPYAGFTVLMGKN